MADFEVHIDLDGRTRQIGLARCNRVRGTETIVFEYDGAWREDPDRFSLEPALALGRGAFAPPAGLATFGSIGDSAPDTWGRRLMQRAGRRLAEREGRAVRTLSERDYLLGVADETRLGALRLRWAGDNTFQAPIRAGVPALIELGRLLQITERILGFRCRQPTGRHCPNSDRSVIGTTRRESREHGSSLDREAHQQCRLRALPGHEGRSSDSQVSRRRSGIIWRRNPSTGRHHTPSIRKCSEPR